MKIKLLYGFLCCLAALAVSGCATMIHGRTQKVFISSAPSGAIAKVDGQIITTPGFVVLNRKDPCTILLTKEGYLPQTVDLHQQMGGLIWLNLIELVPFCAIGMQLDDRWGGAYVIEPSDINVALNVVPPETPLSAFLERLPKPLPTLTKADIFNSGTTTGRSRICVMQKESVNSNRLRVLDGGHAVGLTSPKTGMCWERQAGVVRLTCDTGYQSASKEIHVEAGRTCFVSVVFDRFAEIKIVVLGEQEAKALLNDITLISPDDYILVQ